MEIVLAKTKFFWVRFGLILAISLLVLMSAVDGSDKRQLFEYYYVDSNS